MAVEVDEQPSGARQTSLNHRAIFIYAAVLIVLALGVAGLAKLGSLIP